MLAKWTKILPFFVVEWLVKRACMKDYEGAHFTTYSAFQGVNMSFDKK